MFVTDWGKKAPTGRVARLVGEGGEVNCLTLLTRIELDLGTRPLSLAPVGN